VTIRERSESTGQETMTGRKRSPENCRWADKKTQAMNRKQRTGKYPKGITRNICGNFGVAFKRGGKTYHFGTFKNIQDAMIVAKNAEASL